MTELLDRSARADVSPDDAVSGPARVLLGALSLGAAAIHFVMVPSHAGASMEEGMSFLLAGWVQIALAVLLAWRARRWVLIATIVANAAFILTWAVSRRWGLPIGAHSGQPEAVSFVDGACVALEVGLVIVAAIALARPTLGAQWHRSALVAASIMPVAALVLASAAIASPAAQDHAGSGHDHAAMGGTDGHDHADNGLAALGHSHEGEAAAGDLNDKGLQQMQNGHSSHPADAPLVELDAETAAQLQAQLDQIKPLIEKYPTVAAAEADGYRRQGPFAPALGTHYGKGANLNPDGVMDPADLAHPTLIFDGYAPESKLAGFMYMVFSKTEPEGFAGPNDRWHYHTNVCIVARPGGGVDTPFGADLEIPKAQCDEEGGALIDNTGYMVHVWPVPGYESDKGMFSDLNPKITCPDGSYHMIPTERLARSVTACRV